MDFRESLFSYPNPANLNNYKVTVRFNLNVDSKITITIYTITGKLVRRLAEEQIVTKGINRKIMWDGKNDVGLTIVNGVYLLRVTKEPLDRSGKVTEVIKQGIVK